MVEDADPLGKRLKKIKPSYKVTKYLKKLIENEPCIKRQFVPSIEELDVCSEDLIDPLEEEEHLVTSKCVHKYPDRVLIWCTNVCFANCRFCTRRRYIKKRETTITDTEVDKIVEYLAEHQEVRDVILSGGDPLILNNSQLKSILTKLRKVESVKIIRIGTRAPIVFPKRITNKLVSMLSKFKPLYMNIHVNHPAELTDEVKHACDLLADNGIVLGSQTVLLKGVNDNQGVMRDLLQKLLEFRIRPYYLYLADRVQGTRHFWTEVEDGSKILRFLQGAIGGLSLPKFVRDTAAGKIHLV